MSLSQSHILPTTSLEETNKLNSLLLISELLEHDPV